VHSVEVALGIAQLVCSVTVFASHALQTAFRGWRDLIKDTELLFLTAAFIASCLGLTTSPLFFSFHLLDMVNKSSDLQAVFKAVTLNGRSILLTAVFGACIIWIYASAPPLRL
jgi:hypothetical protein